MMKKIFASIFTLLLFVCIIEAQTQEEKILAKVGDKEITESEFIKRYELMPQIGRDAKGNETALKYELLYTIIAEKLWAIEAEKTGLDTTDIMKNTFKAFEKRYVRDALYNREISSKINLTAKEIEEGMRRNAYELDVQFVFSKDENEINGIFNSLNSGADWDSVFSRRAESFGQVEPYKVTYGKMEKFVEDTLYSKKVGEYTSPLQADHGWYIFKLIKKYPKLITDDRQATSEAKHVRKTVKSRIEDEIYKNFFTGFFKNKEVKTNGYLFWSFADKVINALKNRQVKNQIPIGEKIVLDAEDYYKIEASFGADSLNMVFVLLDKDPVTMKQFIRSFAFEGFFSKTADPDTVRAKLNSRVKTFIEQELLARTGYQQGLQNMPEVKESIDMWRGNYLSNLLDRTFIDSAKISDEEVFDYYQNQSAGINLPKKVNILEILTDSLEVVEKVLNELENGADFKKLAAEHTKRKWTRGSGGEFGLFPVSMYGEIGRIAGQMDIGEIYGPLQVPEGYSIFKLIDVEEEQVQEAQPFESVKENLKKKLSAEKLLDAKINKTVRLANEEGISIDHQSVNRINVTNHSMIVFKLFGFGGQSLAVPLTPPFTEWVEPWQNSQKDLP